MVYIIGRGGAGLVVVLAYDVEEEGVDVVVEVLVVQKHLHKPREMGTRGGGEERREERREGGREKREGEEEREKRERNEE